ncbi:MAG: protein-export chaperone SecB [Spongiibacteraceae bacterium]|nr:protein-export chaperone SecB [Spongiibacteraceae bacterium]
MADNEQAAQQFLVQRLYVKDVSFEAPLGAEVFTKKWQPKINVDLNTKNAALNDESYEVVLTVTLTAKIEEDTAFLIEVQQAGIFLVKGIEGETLRRALGIMAPNILFPYLREAVDGLVIKGGFPAVGLQPVNFEALYMHALEQAKQSAESSH